MTEAKLKYSFDLAAIGPAFSNVIRRCPLERFGNLYRRNPNEGIKTCFVYEQMPGMPMYGAAPEKAVGPQCIEGNVRALRNLDI